MKYYIIAGEASGDLHGANLIKSIRALDSKADIRAWGGDRMQAEGAYLVRHYRDLAFMGFAEVLANLRSILKNLDYCKKDVMAFRPHVVILIDYPGFNLRMAKFLKSIHFRVVYYISPQVWAWKASRIKQIRAYVDKMMVILPFEEAFYQKNGLRVDFVGHPLLDAIEQYKLEQTLPAERNWIALLPGSRKQEVTTMLPLFLEAMKRFPHEHIKIACAPSLPLSFYENLVGNASAELVQGDSYGVLAGAKAALVTSGTATLEAALWGTPLVVAYKGSRLSYLIARSLVKIKYISLVNLIADAPVVEELIQDEASPERMAEALNKVLDPIRQQHLHEAYEDIRLKLGQSGASDRAASLIWKLVGERKKL
jgi:lipid-A-disaccharide synthase